MYDILIIGAGIVGSMIARQLSGYRMQICVADKENDVAMCATKANSAIVHAGFDAMPGTLKARLNVRGSEMMKTVADELGVEYRNNGSLVVAFSEAEVQVLEQLLLRGKQNGVRGLRIIDSNELKEIEPNLSEGIVAALLAPTGAIVCPYRLCIAAMGNAMDNGVEWKRNCEVTGIEAGNGGYRVRTSRGTIEARYVINAAGVYADRIARMVGDASFSIHARRGEYLLFDRECGTVVSHTVFRTPSAMGKGILVTPTPDGNLLLGPTSADIPEKDNTETTAGGMDILISAVRETVKELPLSKSITSFCGLRAVGDTGDFIINSPISGFINVAGIESPGLSSAPAIAEYVEELLMQQGLTAKKKEVFIARRKPADQFRKASIAEKNDMIRREPAYGRIVCRCETITEGEILEAIRENPRAYDLDAVKRRTRAQMGRCQGGFCSPRVAELLAQELGVPLEEITKCGGESKVVAGKTKGRD